VAWAIEQDITTDPASTLVLICLANYADKFGRSAFPSVSTLCKETRLSERTIRYRLDHLEQLGLIRRGNQSIVTAYVKREDRRPVCYDLQMERGANAAPRESTGCNSRHHGVQSTTERGAPAAPDPSLKSVREPKSVLQTVQEEITQRFGTKPTSAVVNGLAQQKRLRK
jgi:hypothetical protein